MPEVKLLDSLGNEHVIDFPESLSNVPLSNTMAFNVCNEDIAIWVSESIENDNSYYDSIYYLYLINRAVSEYLDFDFNALMNYDISDLTDDSGNLLPHVISDHVKQMNEDKLETDWDSAENMILLLYNNIKLLNNSYEFDFRGKENYRNENQKRTK